jgi:hypothetical protein
MAFDPGAVARAFSEHRFDEALDHLAKDVRRTIVGYMVLDKIRAITSYAVEVDPESARAQPPPRTS